MSKNYNEESIRMLRGLDRVRDKVAVVFGGDTIEGAFHTVKEIIANAIDEKREGFGDRLVLTYHEDNSISVQDFGRGVPVGWNEKEEQWNWHLVFNELYAGAKYDEEFDDKGNLIGDYKESLGTNGMGAASTQYTSDFFRVVSKRDNGIYKVNFEKGMPVTSDGQVVDMHGKQEPTKEQLDAVLTVEENTTGETGTYIHWKISNDVFYNTAFIEQMFIDLLESQAHIVMMTIEFHNKKNGKSYVYKGSGIADYLVSKIGQDNVKGHYIVQDSTKGIEENKRYVAKGELHVFLTKDIESKQLFYHNTSQMTEGVHVEAFKSALDQFFKEMAKENGIKRIKPSDYENNISAIMLTSSNTNATRFIGQTKRGVENTFIYNMVHSNVYKLLKDGYIKQDKGIYEFVQSVIDFAKARQESEENAKQAKKIVDIVKETKKKKVYDSKLRDALNTKASDREIFLVEGDSAATSTIEARDKYTHAILPIQGKLPNALKGDILELLENKIILSIIDAIGTGIETGSDAVDIFDMKKCRYSRINILTDADRDGYQIRVLIFAFFYRFMPKLLEAGMVHVVESPILKYDTNRGMYYVYNLSEKKQVEEQIQQDKATIKEVSRAKGLGENSASVMVDSIMNIENRRSYPIQIDLEDRFTQDVINMLFGKDETKERKSYILSMMGNAIKMDGMMRQMVETSLDADMVKVGDAEAEEVTA